MEFKVTTSEKTYHVDTDFNWTNIFPEIVVEAIGQPEDYEVGDVTTETWARVERIS